MSFRNDWHPYNVAEHWPRGSVVLCRIKQNKPITHQHSYLLSLYFVPEAAMWPRDSEFLLVEETKVKNT